MALKPFDVAVRARKNTSVGPTDTYYTSRADLDPVFLV